MPSGVQTEVKTYEMFINGQWVKSRSAKTFAVYDPSTEEVIAEVPDANADDDGGVNRSIKVVECDPAAFASELVRRWRERHPIPVSPTGFDAATGPQGLVFISYAREDELAARCLADGLKAQGCDVYFDRERLGAGMPDFFRSFSGLITPTAPSRSSGNSSMLSPPHLRRPFPAYTFHSVVSRSTRRCRGFFSTIRNWA
jgi:hypothetical protein